MTPRPGGEAGKAGAGYEADWAVAQVLTVLAGEAVAITLEEASPLGAGIEFVVEQRSGQLDAHQVKRQRGQSSNWSVTGLRTEGVLAAAAEQIGAGRSFCFASVVPATEVRELSERARNSDDVNGLLFRLPKVLDGAFGVLADVWGSPNAAWTNLRRFRAVALDQEHTQVTNNAVAGLLIGGGSAASAIDFLTRLVARTTGRRMDADAIWEELAQRGFKPAGRRASRSLERSVADLTDSWKAGVRHELLRPPLARTETEAITATLKSDGPRVLLASGTAGSGKSAVLAQVVGALEAAWPVLALRLDRLEPFTSPLQLGQRLDLDVSPVSALAAVANDCPCLMVLDQLDAVSLASGRMPRSLGAIEDLLTESEAFPRMRVLLACRHFDVENDDRLRRLVSERGPAEQLSIEPLGASLVDRALQEMGLGTAQITEAQLRLLSSPLNLVLLQAVADDPGALSFATTKDLLDRFWARKRREVAARRDPAPRFTSVIDRAVSAMSDARRLAIPASVFDADDLASDADVLASEHVLVSDNDQVAFFHEALFDYAFARLWIGREETLVDFLTSGEQELFRRAQVRQVLVHLRDDNRSRFASEAEGVLNDSEVRFHIKDVVLAILGELPDPTVAEWRILRPCLADRSLADRVWRLLCTPGWFSLLDAEGELERWLTAGGEESGRALDVLRGAVNAEPKRVAELLSPYLGQPMFTGWLRHIAIHAPLGSSRAFFDLVLDAVRRGTFQGQESELWLVSHQLAETRADWGCELLAAYFEFRPGAYETDSVGEGLAVLEADDYSQNKLINDCASAAPNRFLERLLPYMLEVMRLTERPAREERLHDGYFTYRRWRGDADRCGDALLAATAKALRAVAETDLDAFDQFARLLETDSHDAAQWILYQGLASAGQSRADTAAELLLQEPSRLRSGYSEDSFWNTRELIDATTPFMSPALLGRLEQAVLELVPDWELRSKSRGLACFTLLSAIEESRLSQAGRRRIGELRRRFGREHPQEPAGIQAGFVQPPIAPDAASKMDDDQWLRAIATHADSERMGDDFFRGGADEQSNVLAGRTKEEPARFARLGLRLDPSTNPSYLEAILRGVGEATVPVDAESVFALVRHAATWDDRQLDRWLGFALTQTVEEGVPDDIIEVLLGRALYSPDPEEESWLREDAGGARYYGGNPHGAGINTVRGSAAESLARLLLNDADGHVTDLVVRALPRMAEDPSVAVRTCVARVVTACLRHARGQANEAFLTLVRNDDERLLAAGPVIQLMIYVGWANAALVEPSIRRMLNSEHEDVREGGGRLAAFAGLEFESASLFEEALLSEDPLVRKGVADVCAQRLPRAGDTAQAVRGIEQLIDDPVQEVRAEIAGVTGALRGSALAPHSDVLLRLIGSEAFAAGLPQLLFTLEGAPDRVDELVFACARRFIGLYPNEMQSFNFRAAGEAPDVAKLLLRCYATADSPSIRAAALDLLDELLRLGAYGVAPLVVDTER